MTKLTQACSLAIPMLVTVVVAGCQDRAGQETSPPNVATLDTADSRQVDGASADKPQKSDKRKAIAAKAKDELFARLSGRLMEVMQSEGPAEAINVCSNEAVAIAESVGKEYGVSIGRTSFKLRNLNNSPRDWVNPFVEKRTDTPQHIVLDDGSFGALYPIRISVKCLICHGGEEDILDAVKPELAKRYPRDAATGFKLDDLRGWFWVEVPASPKASTPD